MAHAFKGGPRTSKVNNMNGSEYTIGTTKISSFEQAKSHIKRAAECDIGPEERDTYATWLSKMFASDLSAEQREYLEKKVAKFEKKYGRTVTRFKQKEW